MTTCQVARQLSLAVSEGGGGGVGGQEDRQSLSERRQTVASSHVQRRQRPSSDDFTFTAQQSNITQCRTRLAFVLWFIGYALLKRAAHVTKVMRRRLRDSPSVRLSVRLSVCLLVGWINQKIRKDFDDVLWRCAQCGRMKD